MKPQTAWAIKYDGIIQFVTIRETSEECWIEFTRARWVEDFKKQGYSCVEIEIQELGNEISRKCSKCSYSLLWTEEGKWWWCPFCSFKHRTEKLDFAIRIIKRIQMHNEKSHSASYLIEKCCIEALDEIEEC